MEIETYVKTRTEVRRVECGNNTIEYLLTRKSVKNINLRIKPDGKVYVSANPYVSIDFVDHFVKSKNAFIKKALDKYEERKRLEPAPINYLSGESISFLGKKLVLKLIQGNYESVTRDGDIIILMVKDTDNFKRRDKLMKTWLKEKQIEIFGAVCKEIYPIFQKYDVEYPMIKIRAMTSRWGSCQTKKGIITLNSKLIEAPIKSIEYVVLHEFSHFIHPNHSKQFYDFVAKHMPDWKIRKKELEKVM